MFSRMDRQNRKSSDHDVWGLKSCILLYILCQVLIYIAINKNRLKFENDRLISFVSTDRSKIGNFSKKVKKVSL